MAVTYYDTLGTTPDADALTLRRAYHVRSQLLHPDRHAGASPEVLEAAGRAMAELNRAYAVLRHPESRRLYDASVELPAQPEPIAPMPAARPVPEARNRWWRDPSPVTSRFVALA